MQEFEIESSLAAEDCTHQNVDVDDNNILFCLDCGKQLPAPEEVDTD